MTVTFKIELELLEQLDAYAMKNGLNRSEAIRKIIEKTVTEEFKDETIPKAEVKRISLR